MIGTVKLQIYYNICYLISGILAITTHPFFQALNLTIIYFRYGTIRDIIAAIVQTIVPLGYTMYLWAGLQFMFAVISYQFFWEDWYDSGKFLFYNFFRDTYQFLCKFV